MRMLDDLDRFIFNPTSFATRSIQVPFPEQTAFVEDPSHSIAACCTRQAGKSLGLVRKLVKTAMENPHTLSRYFALTQDSAKEILWIPLQEEIERQGILVDYNNADLIIKFPNRSRIRLYGALTLSFTDRMRGPPSIANAIDEAQAFPDSVLRPLIQDVINPSMIKYGKSNFWKSITGTPGPIPKGYFYEVTEELKYGYSVHKWKVNQNPYVPDAEGYIRTVLLENNWTVETPTFQREYLGLWKQDFEALYIKWREELNHYEVLPPGNYTYITGLDFGHNDANFLVTVAYNDRDQTIYLVEEDYRVGEIISDFAIRIKKNQAKYRPIKIVADEGALGKSLAEELRRRHHIPVKAADKPGKDSNAAFLNDYLRRGLFKARRDSRFVEDSFKVQINYDKSTQTRIAVRGHSDAIDAVLYAFKACPAWAQKIVVVQPKVGTAEWQESMSKARQVQREHEVEAMETAAEDWFSRLEQLEKAGSGF